MKKLFISMMALVAVVASCSKSAVVEVPYENVPISFASYNGKTPTVKSSSFVGNDSLSTYGFQVYGYLHNTAEDTPVYTANKEYMNKVVKGTNTGTAEAPAWVWKYDGMSYWPGTLFLDFVAYGLNASSIITKDAQNSNVVTVTIPDAVAQQKDLLVAVPHKNVQYTTNNGTVDLVFKHLLSRVNFALVTKSGNGVDVTIEEIKLEGTFNTTGTIDLTAKTPKTAEDTIGVPFITPSEATAKTTYNFLGGNTFTSTGKTADLGGADIFDNSMLWSFDGGEDTTSSNDDRYVALTKPVKGDDETDEAFAVRDSLYNDAVLVAAKNEQNRYMMIMPTEGTKHQARLFVKYFLPEAGTYDAKVEGIDLKGINFEAGKSYKFLLEVSTNTIDFSVEVTPWDEGTTGENGKNPQVEVIKLN